MPPLDGAPVKLEWGTDLHAWRGRLVTGRGQAVHAAAFLRERRLVLDRGLGKDLGRILIHELFHWVWLRLGNPARRSWESLLAVEMAARARGELGWSAEWRKAELRDRGKRRWREYLCESFCDTAAWLYAGVDDHEEYTLAARRRAARGTWFEELVARGGGKLRV